MSKYRIIITLLISFLIPKNLTLHDFDNPSATHILDVEITNNLLIVSGMLGGIEFYDISDREVLNHLSTLQISGGGGGGSKPNCIITSGNYAYITTNQGLGIINISNPSNPQYLGIVSGTNGFILENLDIYNNVLAVSAHEDGVLFFDISDPENPDYFYTFQTSNAWAVKLEESQVDIYEFIIYVADAAYLTIGVYTSGGSFNILENIYLESAVKDIVTDNDLLYVAIGTNGVNVYQTTNYDEYVCTQVDPCFLDNYNTSVLANRIEPFESKLAVSDWDDIEILEYSSEELGLIGYKNTTRRTMALATKENYIYSGEWASVQIFEYGEIDGPDIDLDVYELNFPFVENGESYVLPLNVENNGSETLEIYDAYTTNDEFIPSILNDILPGEHQEILVEYYADNNNASGSYRILTNDQDQNEVFCETNGNINGANVGEEAPNFNLEVIGNGLGTFNLSEQIGSVVVIAFFAPN